MKSGHLYGEIGAFAGILCLILDSSTAIAGAKTGLALCLETIVPSLLPFFLLSNYIVGLLSGRDLPLLCPIARLCRLPEGGSGFLIPGFLGGYPMGAQAIAEAWKQGELSREDACRMLFFCCNAGPAFLLGMAGPMFRSPLWAWSLWGIHVFSAVVIGAAIPGSPGRACSPGQSGTAFSQSMARALRSLLLVCGWVICFRVLIAFLGKYVLYQVSPSVQAAVSGSLELANGCSLLPLVKSESLRYVLLAGLTGFGGLCVFLQTVSVLQGLPARNYLLGKLLQCLLSTVLAAAAVHGLCLPVAAAMSAGAIVFSKILGNSGISPCHAV